MRFKSCVNYPLLPHPHTHTPLPPKTNTQNSKNRKVARPDAVILPEYYQKPFHAYKQGNLCWDAAMEVEAGA